MTIQFRSSSGTPNINTNPVEINGNSEIQLAWDASLSYYCNKKNTVVETNGPILITTDNDTA